MGKLLFFFVFSLLSCLSLNLSFAQSDGGEIVFSSVRDGARNVYRMDADGGNVRQLTVAGGEYPTWSPDGTSIVFVRANNLYVINADGTGERQLTSQNGTSPSWSPDGTRIAFKGQDGYLHIYDFVTREESPPISDIARSNTRISWSRDGAFLLIDGMDGNLYSLRLDGTDLHQITYSSDIDSAPSWSPNGTQIVVQINIARVDNLYIMDADGGSIRPLTTTGGRWGSWSPDGSQLVYEANGRLWTVNADGSNARTITLDGEQPDWRYDRGISVSAAEATDIPTDVEIVIGEVIVVNPNVRQVLAVDEIQLPNCQGTGELEFRRTLERAEAASNTFAEGEIDETCSTSGNGFRGGASYFGISLEAWNEAKSEICERFHEQLSYTEGDLLQESLEVTMRAAPGSTVTYALTWLRISQVGLVELTVGNDATFMPFSIDSQLAVEVEEQGQTPCS